MQTQAVKPFSSVHDYDEGALIFNPSIDDSHKKLNVEFRESWIALKLFSGFTESFINWITRNVVTVKTENKTETTNSSEIPRCERVNLMQITDERYRKKVVSVCWISVEPCISIRRQ